MILLLMLIQNIDPLQVLPFLFYKDKNANKAAETVKWLYWLSWHTTILLRIKKNKSCREKVELAGLISYYDYLNVLSIRDRCFKVYLFSIRTTSRVDSLICPPVC